MTKNKNLKLIGVATGCTDNIKNEYKVNDSCFGLTIYKDIKKKELKIEITGLRKYMDEVFNEVHKNKKKLSPEEKKKIDEKFEKNKDKPVDTSNWVKPDEESIRNELLKYLALCEIYKEDTEDMISVISKRDILYSILHSHSPNNPQVLTDYAIIDNYDTILSELDNPLKSYTWDMVNSVYGGGMDIKEMREKRKKWKAAQLSKMIIVKK